LQQELSRVKQEVVSIMKVRLQILPPLYFWRMEWGYESYEKTN
jgi:hypothetical protein